MKHATSNHIRLVAYTPQTLEAGERSESVVAANTELADDNVDVLEAIERSKRGVVLDCYSKKHVNADVVPTPRRVRERVVQLVKQLASVAVCAYATQACDAREVGVVDESHSTNVRGRGVVQEVVKVAYTCVLKRKEHGARVDGTNEVDVAADPLENKHRNVAQGRRLKVEPRPVPVSPIICMRGYVGAWILRAMCVYMCVCPCRSECVCACYVGE